MLEMKTWSSLLQSLSKCTGGGRADDAQGPDPVLTPGPGLCQEVRAVAPDVRPRPGERHRDQLPRSKLAALMHPSGACLARLAGSILPRPFGGGYGGRGCVGDAVVKSLCVQTLRCESLWQPARCPCCHGPGLGGAVLVFGNGSEGWQPSRGSEEEG